MATRAKRRDDARIVAKCAETAGAATLDVVAELAATKRDLNLAITYTKGYKTRLERIAMGLHLVSNFILKNEVHAASVAIRSLLANDGKEAREAVENRHVALCLAVEVVEKGLNTDESREVLAKIKTLAPEAFAGGEVAMVTPTPSGVVS